MLMLSSIWSLIGLSAAILIFMVLEIVPVMQSAFVASAVMLIAIVAIGSCVSEEISTAPEPDIEIIEEIDASAL